MTIAPLLFALIIATAADTSTAEPVLLDFHASWCGPCREMRPEVAKLVRKGYPVRDVDFDRARDLVERYNVTAVPTFIVVDPDGRELARSQGYRPATDIAALYNDATTKFAGQRPAEPTARSVARDDADDAVEQVAAARPANPLPWETVVRIKMHMSDKEWGFGSGTIIYSDANESIILTCAHIFKNAHQQAPAPKNFRTPISVDLFDGKIPDRRKPQMQCVQKDIVGEAIDYDLVNDVGLIRIRPGRRLPYSRVVPTSWTPDRGMKMYSVGCSHGNDATAWDTVILDPKVPMNMGNRSFFEMKCRTQPAEGRSGGGLYTTDGYVAGVCDFADPGEHVGLYAVPTAIHNLLNRNQMMALYQPPAEGNGRMLAANNTGRTKYRAQSHDEPEAGTSEVRGLSLPSPELLGIATPEVRVAANTGRARTWGGAESPAAIANRPATRRPDRDAGEAFDPGARPGNTVTTDLTMEPNGDSTILDMPDPKTIPARPEPEIATPRSVAGKWRSVPPSRRTIAPAQ